MKYEACTQSGIAFYASANKRSAEFYAKMYSTGDDFYGICYVREAE